MKPQIVKTSDLERKPKKSPVTLIVESLEGDYLTMGDMAKRYGVHMETMRRLCKATKDDGTQKVNAPTEAVQQGGLLIYLFTPEDVAELDEYFSKRGYVKES